MRILLVDDSPDDRLLTRLRLERAFPAADFQEAGEPGELDSALAGLDCDVVLLDYNLRWTDGLTVLRAIKSAAPYLPVVMLTDSGSEEVAIEGMKAGLSDYVLKGRPQRLPVAIAEGIEKCRLRREYDAALRKQTELSALLSEMNRRKDEFLATLAHELRNPLAAIRTGLEVVKLARDDSEALEEAIFAMERQADLMVRLVDDLLDVARITRGKFELRKRRVPLAEVVREALEMARPSMEEAGHRLAVSPLPESVRLDADPQRLAQALSNLLINAARHTPGGGNVWLSAEAGDGGLVVTVADDGLGIPEDMRELVFEMFTQLDRPLEHGHRGLGVGLALARRLVELHGGAVTARGGPGGRGSVFSVRLPLPADSPRDESAAAPQSPAAPPNRLKVLVVDDNPDAARMLSTMVRLLGCEIETAGDGQEAVELAERFRPDVVLMDIGMPRMNGYDAARHIRRQPWSRGVLLAALTGWGQEEDRARSREAGFDHHLTKPAEPAVLRRILADAARREG